MLIYEKRRKEPLKIIVPENLIDPEEANKKSDCDGLLL